jgi:aryl-phospho-beta-D-glucosidase BglC (GH1 family)
MRRCWRRDGRARAGRALEGYRPAPETGRSDFRGRKQDMSSDTTATADEEALLNSISNHVALAGNNVSVEMLQLAAEVYGPDVETGLQQAFSYDPLEFEPQPHRNTGATVAVAPQTRGWDAVTASELGMAAEDQSPPLKYSFVGGQYQAIDTSKLFGKQPAEANALVLSGLVHDPVSNTDKPTLALVIRGTDQLADGKLDYYNFETHYAKFAPLVAALHNYLAANADGIQQVLISGHSLGSGVVPYFLQAFPDTASYTVRAYVDGPTGSEVDLHDSRIVNFVHAGMMFPAAGDHEGDNVPMLGEVSHGDYSNIGNTNVPDGKTGNQWIDDTIKSFLPSGVLPKTRDGSDILIDSDVAQAPPTGFLGLVGPQHNHNLYAADLAKLVRFADDDNSPFAGTEAALALKLGTVYQGSPVAIAVGQPDKAELGALTSTTTNFVDPSVYVGKAYASDIHVYWRDDFVLSEANGTIHWDQPWKSSSPGEFNPAEHVHVVDGGSTAAPSTVVLQGSLTDYHVTTQMTGLGLEADLSWVDSVGHENLIGHLYRTKSLLFLPTTISSSAAGADITSAAEPQFMLHLDGSAVTVQTALVGQTALTVDPSFDYTDAGDESLTITGSGLGDIIALGSGNNTVNVTTGSNIIFVKDAATAGSNIIHGGDGFDTIVQGQGNDTIVGGSGITTVYYSGARSEYQITRLDGGALQIADPGIGTPEGTDALSGVEFFRFADNTYEFSAPVIATTDVAAVYGQTFAASDLFAAVDSDGPILSYQLLDSTPDPTSGKWLLGGAPQAASQIIDVSAAQLAQIEFQSGFGTDNISVRAFDGIDWSEWTPLTVASPINPTSLLIGVNLAGAEFAPPYNTDGQRDMSHPNPGVFDTNYTYPTHAEIDYYAAKGMSVIRLPFLWERIQPAQNQPLDAAELGRLDDVVSYTTGKGLKIEIELHDYGYGFGGLIGAQTPNSSFADVWGKLAGHFKSNSEVIFGLMNEPHTQSATDWLASANAAIAAIRSAGAMQEILVPGTGWDGGWSWTLPDTNNATVIGPGVVDPGHNFAFEVHQYLDSDSSGTHPGVVSPTIGVERLTAITQWARDNHQRLFLGEVGVDQQAISLQALDNMLTYIKQHTDVWSGVTYWAGGPWWGNYMFSIEPQNVNNPSNYGDKPQMGILEKHLAGPAGDYNGTPGVDSFSTTGDSLQAYGNDGNDQLDLTGSQNLLSGGDGDDRLRADGAGNVLYGDAGNDSLTALGASNLLFGGTGNDAYFVDNTGNGAIEGVGGGIDTVYGTTHLRLADNVENSVLLGSTDLQSYGNGGSNAVYGNAGSNLLDGGAGVDSMYGLAGNDVYFVDDPGDVVIENPGEGSDAVSSTAHFRLPADVEALVLQGSADLQGYGNNLGNLVYGNSGNNLLDGAGGADGMIGGAGNDVYFVDNPGDAVIENPDDGNDTVFSTAHLRLPVNVEYLVLQGSADLQGYGNDLGNLIYGNSGNNLLDGAGGADAMVGGAGNDVYFVDDPGDAVIENPNEGSDTVFASAHFRLSANVENLVVQGSSDLQGYGNGDSNTLYGNGGVNLLDGGGGADVLVGNAGDDAFLFHQGEANGDIIVDFAGNGASAGDVLVFVGYGPGATFTQNDATQWQVNYDGGSSHEVVVFMNGAAVDQNDVVFM